MLRAKRKEEAAERRRLQEMKRRLGPPNTSAGQQIQRERMTDLHGLFDREHEQKELEEDTRQAALKRNYEIWQEKKDAGSRETVG